MTDGGSAQASYYAWVDQFDTLGLGRDVPIATGNFTDSLEALVDDRFVTLRVPYPDGLPRQGLRRPHRRSECRLEGQGGCGRPMPAARPGTSKATRNGRRW